MEFDSQSQYSDEGVELSVSENGEVYPTDYPFLEDTQPSFLEARSVYLLMQKNVPVSRACRLQWLLDHLNTIVTPSQKLTESSSNLEVISAIPREQNSLMKCNRFLITYRTELKFVAQRYRFVFCLDMSPSHANVDTHKGEILFDEILDCFKASIEGLCKEFSIPGNSAVFQPNIYLTVIVNTPFFLSPAQQVLVKGVRISPDNLKEIVSYVEKQFHLLEEKIADVSAAALDQLDFQRAQNEGLVGDLFDLPESGKMYSRIPMVTPDVNFVNMLRYSMLAISLLPEISLSHILVITDGVVAMPDSNIMESLLFQLHYDSISISFLKVGAPFHPHSGSGFVTYMDLLYFFAHSTLGTCMENFVFVKNDSAWQMNIYQEHFLIWSFHSADRYNASRICDNKWTMSNDTFYSHNVPSLLSKRQTDENTSASILLLLSRRMREGFTIDNVFYMNGNLEVKLILQWKSSIFIHYKVKSQWPVSKNLTHFEVYISAPYEFLHDITCIIKKESKSLYRQAIIERFWMRLSQLSSGDLGLAQQLSSFQISKDWYTLPESVRNGIPVYVLNNSSCSDATRLILTPSDVSCLKFLNIWQPICQMETNNWRKWFHTHKISLILQHDNPLPKYLHLAKSSQRFQVIQCRQAATALYGLLAEWATFILIDNHTYLKFLYKESDKPPSWFCIIRISSKFPCAVINMGFSNGTPGVTRHEVCEELKIAISALSYLSSPFKVKENYCCVLLQKPLEKILIRYERIPSNYTTVIFPDGTQPPHSPIPLPSPATGTLFTTLSRYLFHKRWIWSASLPSNPRLPDQSISRILKTLTRMRIKEGFTFAHSASGIITMVLELWMEPTATCVVQYVLFPPHYAYLGDEVYSGSEEDNEQSSDTETELQMVTEVWIEPQFGRVLPTNPRIGFTDNKHYYEIADVICQVDLQCISALLTMEHLSLMCQEREIEDLSLNHMGITSLNTSRKSFSRRSSKNSYLDSPAVPEKGTHWYPIISPRIEHIPFKFDPISILPLSQQTELLFSMFIEGREKRFMNDNSADKANRLLLENILEHLGLLHDRELELTKDDSDRFTQEILLRHKNKHPQICPISENVSYRGSAQESEEKTDPQWRCFIKGVSMTHVILTFVASTLDDLKALTNSDHTNIPSVTESLDGTERASSRGSCFSDALANDSLCLPIYVFDCPLGRLVNVYVDSYEESSPSDEDVYEDHRFKSSGDVQEDCIKLKGEDRPEESEAKGDIDSEQSNVKLHCKTLVITHSKCYTISLFLALHMGVYVHSYDVQSAMDLCEESITEIDITEYMKTICGHVKQSGNERMPMRELHQATPCSEIKSLHMLIKDKFFKMISNIFNPIPTHSEFYFYKNLKSNETVEETVPDSDDEVSENPSEVVEFRSEEVSVISEGPPLLQRIESGVSGISEFLSNSELSPLFLHLICTLRYNGGECSNTSIRVLPTCLGELIQNLEKPTDFIEKSNLQVTLDMLCLTLPPDVQNIIIDYSNRGLRTTSFCSDGFQPSIASSVSDGSFISQVSEPLKYLSDGQKKSIISLSNEIKWLLRDEICTALLDVDPVTSDTLNYVMNHVAEGSKVRTSCVLDVINLNFVFATPQSHEKFVQEFSNLKLPYSGYKLCKKNELYYLTKDPSDANLKDKENFIRALLDQNIVDDSRIGNLARRFQTDDFESNQNEQGVFSEYVAGNEEHISRDQRSQQSEISSINGSVPGTDGGYDEDVSEDYDDYEWLIAFNNKRMNLPNFWLIMKVSQDVVDIYFHCRFLELPTIQVGVYLEVQRAVCEAVRDLCKKVNQLLLLQTLYETKTCGSLLELDDSSDFSNSPISRNPSYSRLKSMEVPETSEEIDIMSYSASLSESSMNFKVGEFSCPVVWETHFVLHPRLKTGPGKSGISRGILALKNILDKFSVSNRNNMFVYRDNQLNVFYLRLHENIHYSVNNKSTLVRAAEFEGTTVSRSPSVASLPFCQNKSALTQSEQSITSVTSGDIRPRVRSFGERETKEYPTEDTLVLKVHGITEAGSDVQQDLVQVLQNRLDDAVLEFLSITLARNAMCPLTPEDVHFIQRPFRPPEVIIRLTIQEFALQWLESFIHYLKQNLLQFMNVPKYTDTRPHYQFKDYEENKEVNQIVCDDNIFLYNQSQNPSSGNRGIACIALAFINYSEQVVPMPNEPFLFSNIFETGQFGYTVSSEILDNEGPLPPSYLEFRLWKQGRVNVENLSQKLKAAVSQATWDIIMEYYLLKKSVCVPTPTWNEYGKCEPVKLDTLNIDFDKEVVFNCVLDMNTAKNIKDTIMHTERPIVKHVRPRKKRNRHTILPTLKATRSITFDDEEKEKESNKDRASSNKPTVKLDSFEKGDDGVLSVIYSKYLPNWLEFGYNLNTPSVKRHKINLANRHSPDIIIKELMNILQDSPKSFKCIPTNSIEALSENMYAPNVTSYLIPKYVVISRNLEHWSATIAIDDASDIPDCISPHSLKHSQKFVPATCNNVFIPRQKILWISVENDNIIIYTYNWTNENIDKLTTSCANLGLWLCVRSCFLNSVISQKLGLFHNQPLTRKIFMIPTNPYASLIGLREAMLAFPKDHSHKRIQPTYNLPATLEAFRDNFRICEHPAADPVVTFTIEMREMKNTEKRNRDEMKTLHSMYQSRTSTVTVPQIFLLMQNSRALHFCHTPLLFLPRWRLKSASTRDHSLYPSQAIQLADRMASEEKEKWHSELCYGFFSEYRHYMQTLGFMPLQIDNPLTGNAGLWTKDKSSYNNVFYIQKTILGGILIFTVEFCEPFFMIKLLAIECNRLQNISSRASINRFTLSFLDECDRVKTLMHLHSFTYDYHLRCIYNYVSGSSSVNRVCERYNVHQFLDDFLKYYNKAPNFARNLVHTDTLTIKNLVTEGKQLYDYLLSNVSQYDFKVFEMDGHDTESEFILVQVTSTPQVSYKDSQDRHHTDDFDITLVVNNLCTPYSPKDNVLHLRYYLILTSKREIYPKFEVDEKLGKFRTVSSTARSLSALEREPNDLETSMEESDRVHNDPDIASSAEHSDVSNRDSDDVLNKPASLASVPSSLLPYVEINQESVNYLGYYSSHEQLMQQLILDKANTTQKHIKDMVDKGMVHCRTHLLWNRLITPHESSSLTYEEFLELKNLARLEHVCHLHPNLRSLLNQPLNWYQGLAKLLLVRYVDHNRSFISPDGNIQHHVILHHEYFGAFMLLSMDLHTSRGDLYAVYREPQKNEDAELCLSYQKSLLNGFVNCICFYLWSGIVAN
ncbi:unnamed protein product [Phaedon cochleariae]|uniref:KICSTOR complex protein SZT2 n=1 Tax=Phaedon cochleariae TaxID=80249 RepID=A0A9P0GLD8_PHACE|nr:unnamed protein product [Phaedon cochleariae]